MNLVLCLTNLLSYKDPSITNRVIEFIRVAVKVDLSKVLDTVLK